MSSGTNNFFELHMLMVSATVDKKKGVLELGELEYPLFFSPPWHLTISICNLKNLLVPELMKLEYHLLPALKLC